MGPNVGPKKEGTQKAHIEQGRVGGPMSPQTTIYKRGEERESTT